jgi:DNA-binding SARP family transcriptional activator
MNVLRIFLFGKFCVRCGQQTLAGLEAHKVQELFCYLVLYKHRSHRREILANLLWPTNTAAQSTKYLRHALWQLRTAFDADSSMAYGNVLSVDPKWVSINLEGELWIDVIEFERVYACVQDIPGQELKEPEMRSVQDALKLYRGSLLEGWYQDWCCFERERLQDMYLALLEKLMAYCETHGEYEAGLQYGMRALRCDVAHERIHRRLMRLYYLAGNRTAALRQYARCVAFLRRELDVDPSAHTTALYEQIRADSFFSPGEALSENGTTASDTAFSSLPQALYHLKQLQAAFGSVQIQLQEAIRQAEMALNRRE